MTQLESLSFDPRVTIRREGAPASNGRCVVYWMQRAQRALDNPALHIEFPEHGGHVGFVGGSVPGHIRYYGERRALDFLAAQLAPRVDGAASAR